MTSRAIRAGRLTLRRPAPARLSSPAATVPAEDRADRRSPGRRRALVSGRRPGVHPASQHLLERRWRGTETRGRRGRMV